MGQSGICMEDVPVSRRNELQKKLTLSFGVPVVENPASNVELQWAEEVGSLLVA